MPESAHEMFGRALAAAGSDGRLAMPPVEGWETFPFEGDIRVRALLPPVAAEPPRRGEGGAGCHLCERPEEHAVWGDERWSLRSLGQPSGLPVVVVLFPRAHHDLHDLPPELASELGPLILRVEAAVRSVGEIARVHVGRWGDGSEHLHWWFMARPARLPQLVGSFAAIWDDILPPVPEEVWRETLRVVGHALAEGGGREAVARDPSQ